ncbi:helix-turn-helix domain-containing protein [Roseomonas sp. GCM10028921]
MRDTIEPVTNARDTAKHLGVSPQTVRRLIRSGTLPALKIGARVVIRTADVNAMLERGTASTRIAA